MKYVDYVYANKTKLGLGRRTKESIMDTFKSPIYYKEDAAEHSEENDAAEPSGENKPTAPTMYFKLFRAETKTGSIFESKFFTSRQKAIPWKKLEKTTFEARLILNVWYLYVGGGKIVIQNQCVEGVVKEVSPMIERSQQVDAINEINAQDPDAADRLEKQLEEIAKIQAEEDFFSDDEDSEKEKKKKGKDEPPEAEV